MATFLALYQGKTIGEAQIVAVSADPELVGYVASELFDEVTAYNTCTDKVLESLNAGRKDALGHIVANCINKRSKEHSDDISG